MAWDFDTEPEFEEQHVWMRAFIDRELIPLEPIRRCPRSHGCARSHPGAGDRRRTARGVRDVASHQALARRLTPDDTAAVVTTLTRDDAAGLTGQTLTVDGGLVLH